MNSLLSRSRYSHVRNGKVGEKIETWPGRRQGRVFVSFGHPSLRISLPIGAELRFESDLESKDYNQPYSPAGKMESREVTVCRMTNDKKKRPFRIALLAKGGKHPVALDYIRARQIAVITSLPNRT